jgi:large subunit ribosomal protein L3
MGLIGRKIGMTQVFWDDGTALGCTALEVGPCVVTAVRTTEKHGYAAVQLGFGEKPARLLTRPEAGRVKQAGIEKAPRVVREMRLADADAGKYEVGKVLNVAEVFKSGDVVDITGNSKGKGYQGVLKRHHLGGTRATHGTHEFFRHGGSIGCRLTPGRVHKGKRMTGHMGDVRCTTANLVVVKVLEDKNVVLIKGSVPGAAGSVVLIKGAIKNVKRSIVSGPVKEVESKNPMKASKKGQSTAKPAKK